MKLDERIKEAITLPNAPHTGAHSKYVYSPDVAMAVKQLIRDVVEYVKPERNSLADNLHPLNHRNVAIDEMEAKVKELGL